MKRTTEQLINDLRNHTLTSMRDAADRLQELSKQKAELDQVWDMLARAMSVIDDLTNLRPPCSRTQQEIDDLQEGIHEIEGRQQ
jgi:hypothetical protein